MAKFSCNFISYTFKRTVDITVVIPTVTIPESLGPNMGTPTVKPSHAKGDKYPVLYLLHGYGNNHATWSGYTRIELFAEEQNIAVVMFSADNKFYANYGEDNYFTFIEDELPDFVCAMFPVSKRPEDTFIAGLSMGGFGALSHGLYHPEKYAAIGAFSAVTSIDSTHLAGGPMYAALSKIDPLSLAKKIKAEGRRFPKLYIACGEKDSICAADALFKDELVTLGADVTWESVPDYRHEWRFWDLQIEKYLEWIPRSDPYSKIGKRQI
jgi:putative tributyrin esterase